MRAPLGRAMGRQGVRILPQSAPPPCPARMGGRFPGSSRLPSTVWVFVLKLALNASPVLSQFTRVYSGSSVVLLTVFRLVNVY